MDETKKGWTVRETKLKGIALRIPVIPDGLGYPEAKTIYYLRWRDGDTVIDYAFDPVNKVVYLEERNSE